MDDRVVMTAAEMRLAIERLARDVGARHAPDRPALVGIQRRGAVLAGRIAATLDRLDGWGLQPTLVGTLDISLYRDDLSELATYPIVGRTAIPFDLTSRTVVLVDDVLFTGRTVRAALTAILDHGRPRAIHLAVLVDRGHRELPIRPDLVGRNLPTAREERVNVHVEEIDGTDEVTLGRPIEPPGTDLTSAGGEAPGTG